ncbi:endonuclease [Pseudomonas phage 201phi2-1]|uniref:Putative homing endonuclease n=1 Tax=Pseudomonas phage 201phi2-1 TaxID=198110 RepID=B3FJI4_BP201|nr:endonuclease [Pseudomonas phage 201phi2-1]ABY63149.1 putative homing endonuclease [Pseudomonas phage 201phi2-1]
MSFETTFRGNQWTHSSSIKGGRREIVKKGVYVIDHRNTGKFIVGTSSDVSKEVDKHMTLLAKGKSPIKQLQQQYIEEAQRENRQPVFVVIEYALNSDKDIKRTLKEIRETNTTPYCLLN